MRLRCDAAADRAVDTARTFGRRGLARRVGAAVLRLLSEPLAGRRASGRRSTGHPCSCRSAGAAPAREVTTARYRRRSYDHGPAPALRPHRHDWSAGTRVVLLHRRVERLQPGATVHARPRHVRADSALAAGPRAAVTAGTFAGSAHLFGDAATQGDVALRAANRRRLHRHRPSGPRRIRPPIRPLAGPQPNALFLDQRGEPRPSPDGQSGHRRLRARAVARDQARHAEVASMLQGSSDGEALLGLSGHDRLYGRAGNDLLDGGPGSDRLHAGKGGDVMIGGGAADLFVFGAGSHSRPSAPDLDSRLLAPPRRSVRSAPARCRPGSLGQSTARLHRPPHLHRCRPGPRQFRSMATPRSRSTSTTIAHAELAIQLHDAIDLHRGDFLL